MPVEGSTGIHNGLLEALRTEVERERLRINECEALDGNLDLLNNMDPNRQNSIAESASLQHGTERVAVQLGRNQRNGIGGCWLRLITLRI